VRHHAYEALYDTYDGSCEVNATRLYSLTPFRGPEKNRTVAATNFIKTLSLVFQTYFLTGNNFLPVGSAI